MLPQNIGFKWVETLSFNIWFCRSFSVAKISSTFDSLNCIEMCHVQTYQDVGCKIGKNKILHRFSYPILTKVGRYIDRKSNKKCRHFYALTR